jgi:hypothetical protein
MLALLASPVRTVADGCTGTDTALLIKGEGFKSVPLQVRPGGVRIGTLEFNYVGEEVGWSVTRPTEGTVTDLLAPATQIVVHEGVIEIRSLDRKSDSLDEAPDATLTAVAGDTGTEIRIAAKGDAMVEVAGKRRAPASKELAVGCSGISLFVSLRVL